MLLHLRVAQLIVPTPVGVNRRAVLGCLYFSRIVPTPVGVNRIIINLFAFACYIVPTPVGVNRVIRPVVMQGD